MQSKIWGKCSQAPLRFQLIKVVGTWSCGAGAGACVCSGIGIGWDGGGRGGAWGVGFGRYCQIVCWVGLWDLMVLAFLCMVVVADGGLFAGLDLGRDFLYRLYCSLISSNCSGRIMTLYSSLSSSGFSGGVQVSWEGAGGVGRGCGVVFVMLVIHSGVKGAATMSWCKTVGFLGKAGI